MMFRDAEASTAYDVVDFGAAVALLQKRRGSKKRCCMRYEPNAAVKTAFLDEHTRTRIKSCVYNRYCTGHCLCAPHMSLLGSQDTV